MEQLREAILRTPIVDHHAHNLLTPQAADTKELLAITSEAGGDALVHARSTLAHIRAVRQLSEILGTVETWEAVVIALKKKRAEQDGLAWLKRCFEGIHTLLLDDGLDPTGVVPYQEHGQLTGSKAFRIVRIETIAEQIILKVANAKQVTASDAAARMDLIISDFTAEISRLRDQAEVVGFKSVICYRIGLDFAILSNEAEYNEARAAGAELLAGAHSSPVFRLQHPKLNPLFLLIAAQVISKNPKPIQFHTGLGDNDLDIRKASPAHLRPFIEKFPTIPVVLLHGGYPYTRDGAYLASVYPNCYLDVGEVFPMVSQAGQEAVLSQALELCPTEKLLWSTDGHWFPETYLLAVIQLREALEKVLGDYVRRSALTEAQAVRVVQDMLFNTANTLYDLKLQLQLFPASKTPRKLSLDFPAGDEPQLLRIEWIDYTSTMRARHFPLKEAKKRLRSSKFLGISTAVLGLLQNDSISPGFKPVGEYLVAPIFETLRRIRYNELDYAVARAEFRQPDGSECDICPRTVLRRCIEAAASKGVEFLVGYESEVVFVEQEVVQEDTQRSHNFTGGSVSQGHAWSTIRAMHNPRVVKTISSILADLEHAGIELQQFHPEAAPGQYEFITAPLPPLEAADALLTTREIIQAAASRHSLRATFVPKPFPMAAGTGAHVHISLKGAAYEPFYAGILRHLRGICAFTYSNAESYLRVADHCWAGGRYVTWGTQNRETPLRKVEDSHWELKCVDGLANAYLALAVILQAGLLGLERGDTLSQKDCPEDPAMFDEDGRKKLGIVETLPENLDEAIDSLQQDKQLVQAIGTNVVETYIAVKKAESALLSSMDGPIRRNWLIERY